MLCTLSVPHRLMPSTAMLGQVVTFNIILVCVLHWYDDDLLQPPDKQGLDPSQSIANMSTSDSLCLAICLEW